MAGSPPAPSGPWILTARSFAERALGLAATSSGVALTGRRVRRSASPCTVSSAKARLTSRSSRL
jgi:hypothetical protein